jgi:FkbM family methyltransferase
VVQSRRILYSVDSDSLVNAMRRSVLFGKFGRKLVQRTLPKSVQLWLRSRYLVHEIIRSRRRQAEMDYLPQVVHEGDNVIDVGANAGAYSFELSKLVGPGGHVFAFEPVAHSFSILCATIKRAGLKNVTPLQIALSDRPGSRKMVIPNHSAADYYLAKFACDWETGDQEAVHADTLDSLLAQGRISAPTFIKCDVEGSSAEVIRGAVALIQQHRPIWLVEIWYENEFQLMAELGYEGFYFSRDLVRAGSLVPPFTDFFFFPR